jgi:hypothetical protein
MENGRPFVYKHFAGLLVAAAQEALGRLVVEKQRARHVHDKDGRGKAAGELPHQNNLDLLLCHARLR